MIQSYRDRHLLEDLCSVTHLRSTQFFALQTQLHFVTAASYEIYLPPNLDLRADGGLCIPPRHHIFAEICPNQRIKNLKTTSPPPNH